MYELYFLTILVAFALPFFAKAWFVACTASALLIAVMHGKYCGKQGDWTYVNLTYTTDAWYALLVGALVSLAVSYW